MVAANREVLISMKVVGDKTNAETLRAIGKQAEAVQEQVNKAIDAGAARVKKFQESAKKDEERRRRERDTAYRDDLNAAIKSGNDIARERRRAVDSQIAEEKRLDRERERIAARDKARSREAVEGTRQMAQGFLQLGRAIALTGVVGERDMQKIVNVLAKAQIATDLFRGVTDLGVGVSKTGIGRALGGAFGSLGAGVGLGAGGAAMAVGGGIAATAGLLAVGHTQTGANFAASSLSGIAGLGFSDLSGRNEQRIKAAEAGQRRWGGGLGYLSTALKANPFTASTGFGLDYVAGDFVGSAQSEAKTARMQSAAMGRQSSMSDVEANTGLLASEAMARRSMSRRASLNARMRGVLDPERQAMIALQSARMERGGARAEARMFSNPSDSEREINAGRTSSAIQEELQATERLHGVRRAIQETQRDTIRETISGLQQEKQRQDEIAKSYDDRLKSARQRVGEASPEDMQRLKQINAKIDRGERLTREEGAFAGQFGLEKFDYAREQSNEQRVREFMSGNKASDADLYRRNKGERATDAFDTTYGGEEVRRRDAAREKVSGIDDAIDEQSNLFNEVQEKLTQTTKDNIKVLEQLRADLDEADRRLLELQQSRTKLRSGAAGAAA